MSRDPILNRKYQREWYNRNKDKKRTLVRKRKDKHRAFLNQLKKSPCKDCGGKFPPYCMDFDNRPNEKKLFNLAAARTRSRASVIAEVAKCDIVCAICHRIRTHVRRTKKVI